MASLVTLDTAKRHLRIDTVDSNADVSLKITHASAIVLDYLKSRADVTWTDVTAPAPVQAATLLLVAHLYEHRGDNMDPDPGLWMAVERLLIRYRDPALA